VKIYILTLQFLESQGDIVFWRNSGSEFELRGESGSRVHSLMQKHGIHRSRAFAAYAMYETP